MKNKLTVLTLLPILMLSSCGNGQEIKDEARIKELKDGITAKAREVENYELIVEGNSNSYDEDAQKNSVTKSTVTYRANKNNDRYIETKATVDGQKSDSNIYLVANEKYQQVLYIATYNTDTKKDDISVYGYEGNEMTFAFASFYFLVPSTYYDLFSNPNGFDVSKTAIGSDVAHEYDTEIKYYSKGDGNLTIKVDSKVVGEISKEENEYPTSATYVINYDNYLFKTAKVNQKSNKGNKSDTEISLNVKDDFDITLPSGWEDLINLATLD